MTSTGLLCIFLGFLIMILIIANNLILKGVLIWREQKIKIFFDEFNSMTKEEKIKFANDYFNDKTVKIFCSLFN